MKRGGCLSRMVWVGVSLLAIVLLISGGQWLRQHVRAGEVLDRWAKVVAAAGGQPSFGLVGERAQLAGNLEPAMAGDGKMAYVSGAYDVRVALPGDTPPDATVTWPDGSREPVPVLPAGRAIDAVRTDQAATCQCTPLRVIGATLTTTPGGTSRGVVDLPAWELTLEGTAVRIRVIAVAQALAPALGPDATPAWYDNPIAGVEVWPDGQTALVTFMGWPADGACTATYDIEPVESDTGVVLLVHENACFTSHFPLPGFGGEAIRTAFAHLSRPLGARALLDARTGGVIGYKRHVGPAGPIDEAGASELVRAWIADARGGPARVATDIRMPKLGLDPQGRQAWFVEGMFESSDRRGDQVEIFVSRFLFIVDIETGAIVTRQLEFTTRTPGPSGDCDGAAGPTPPPGAGSAAPSPACTHGTTMAPATP